MMARVADNALPIYKVATTTSTVLIATHGLERAYEISNRIQEQIVSHIKRQIENHPDEWSTRIKREVAGLPPVPPVPITPPVPGTTSVA